VSPGIPLLSFVAYERPLDKPLAIGYTRAMKRLLHFLDNAGGRGCVLTLLVLASLGIVLRRDFAEGTWPWLLLPVLACFGIPYLFRDLLVAYAQKVQIGMKIALMAAVTAAVLIPRWDGREPMEFRVIFAVFLGSYLGCYFWLLSDSRVRTR
jgi:hypothetical protein